VLRDPFRKKASVTAGFTWPPLILERSHTIRVSIAPIKTGFPVTSILRTKRNVPKNSARSGKTFIISM